MITTPRRRSVDPVVARTRSELANAVQKGNSKLASALREELAHANHMAAIKAAALLLRANGWDCTPPAVENTPTTTTESETHP